MTTNPTTIDAAGWLRNDLEPDDAGGDLLAALVKDFAEAMLDAITLARRCPGNSTLSGWTAVPRIP